jgi:tetratricopeptide (TPR) repeat protein
MTGLIARGDRLATWHRLLAARRTARRGDAPGLVLATASSPAGRASYEALQQRVAPTPEVAALLSATTTAAGPFAGRRALLIGVGVGAARDITATLANRGRTIVSNAFLVDPMTTTAVPDDVERARGDFWEQVDASLQWAGKKLNDGIGDFIAILLRTPVTGDWAHDREFDLDRLIESLLTPAADVWLAVTDPGDPTTWPDEVTISFPAPVRTLLKAVRKSGLPNLPRRARVDRYTVRLPAADAAALVVALTKPRAKFERMPSGIPEAGRYGACVTLALGPDAREGRAVVAPDDEALRAAEEFLEATGTRITSQLHGTERRLPLTAYPSCTVAWRLLPSQATKVTSLSSAREQATARSSAASLLDESAKDWLGSAIDSNDEAVASAILAAHGRAWIEEADVYPALRLIESAKQAFEIGSRAGLWAHYLLALDSALRRSEPDNSWFTEEICTFADTTELGLLFWTERAEFARLRRDMKGACVIASGVMDKLKTARNPGDSSTAYVVATSRYVIANLLRQGGQYELARQLIEDATIQYEPKLPSHRVELTHCLYGRSVCDAMRGVTAVRAVGDWTIDEAVFAQSLVTLANSHAAWFVADYDRAIQFAEEARLGFARIGYERYATRAERLEGLLDDWARRSGRPRPAGTARLVDESVNQLLAAPPKSRVTTLSRERPSRALSVLQFALAYGDNPDADRIVELPRYITVTPSQGLITVTPPAAASYQEADNALRDILGVGARTPVPLAVD